MRTKSPLEDKGFFIKVAWLGFGTPTAIILFWLLRESMSGFGLWISAIAIGMTSGLIWANIMWHVFKNIYGIEDSKNADSQDSVGK